VDIDEYKLVKENNIALQKRVETLEGVIKTLTAKQEPQKIAWDTGKSIEVDPALVASGAVVIEQPPEQELQLKANQISRSNKAAINANLGKIASGEVEVV
jgi:Holliday junction resolvasome RuvABC endonuclease subunit